MCRTMQSQDAAASATGGPAPYLQSAPQVMLHASIQQLMQALCKHPDGFLTEAWVPVPARHLVLAASTTTPTPTPTPTPTASGATASGAPGTAPSVSPLTHLTLAGIPTLPPPTASRSASSSSTTPTTTPRSTGTGTTTPHAPAAPAAVTAAGTGARAGDTRAGDSGGGGGGGGGGGVGSKGSIKSEASAADPRLPPPVTIQRGASHPTASETGTGTETETRWAPQDVAFCLYSLVCAKKLVANVPVVPRRQQGEAVATRPELVTTQLAQRYQGQHTLSMKLCKYAMRERRMQWCFNIGSHADHLLRMLRVGLKSALAFPVFLNDTLHAVIVLYSHTISRVRCLAFVVRRLALGCACCVLACCV